MASLMKPPITWPRGVKSAVCITFDLDAETAWISRDPANIDRLSVMSQGAYGPKVGVPLILDFLDRNQMKSTFFVPGWTAERWPDVVAEIHRRGHEIGHHGYLHEALEGRSREEEEAILTGSSKILADITGLRPVGYRAPLYEITHETAGLLAKHGFLYASNLQDSLWPYRYVDTPSLVELPPSAVRSVWGDEFRGIHALGGLTMLILHPQYTGRPSRLNMLQQLVDEMRDTGDVWFVNGMELARYALTDAANISSDGRPRVPPE